MSERLGKNRIFAIFNILYKMGIRRKQQTVCKITGFKSAQFIEPTKCIQFSVLLNIEMV